MSQEVKVSNNPYDDTTKYTKVEKNMFDRNWQIGSIAYQQRKTSVIDISDHIVFGVLKRAIHVFLLLTCLSCVYIVYIVQQEEPPVDRYEQQASKEVIGIYNFLKYQKKGKFKEVGNLIQYYEYYFFDGNLNHSNVIHPVYLQLQQDSPMNLNQEEGMAFALSDVEYRQDENPIKADQFYRQHVSKSLPCIFRGEIAQNEAVQELNKANTTQELDYLLSQIYRPVSKNFKKRSGHSAMDDIAFHQEKINFTLLNWKKRTSKEFQGSYDMFLKQRRDDTYRESNYYMFIEDQPLDIKKIDGDADDFHIKTNGKEHKHLMEAFMKPHDRRYTQWNEFVNRKAKKLNYEQHICVYHGREEFILVSPIYKKNLYVNVYEHFHAEETPINFFDVDYGKFKLAREINWLQTTLLPGDCMYVPAYFYVQSRTHGAESIMITERYESHSKFIDLIFQGLDQHGLDQQQDEKEKELFDKAVGNVLGWMGMA